MQKHGLERVFADLGGVGSRLLGVTLLSCFAGCTLAPRPDDRVRFRMHYKALVIGAYNALNQGDVDRFTHLILEMPDLAGLKRLLFDAFSRPAREILFHSELSRVPSTAKQDWFVELEVSRPDVLSLLKAHIEELSVLGPAALSMRTRITSRRSKLSVSEALAVVARWGSSASAESLRVVSDPVSWKSGRSLSVENAGGVSSAVLLHRDLPPRARGWSGVLYNYQARHIFRAVAVKGFTLLQLKSEVWRQKNARSKWYPQPNNIDGPAMADIFWVKFERETVKWRQQTRRTTRRSVSKEGGD